MPGTDIRRPGLRAAGLPLLFAPAFALSLALAPAPALSQTAVEEDPVLGPLLQGLMEEEVPVGTGAVDASDPEGEAATIDGFRSAEFGMTEDEVLAAIEQDFGVAEADVIRETNELERTRSLIAVVEDLLPDSGTAAVVYILGHRSDTLIQVNVIWGAPIDEDYSVEDLLVTGRSLQDFFAERRYAEGSAFANVMLADGTLVLFTGSDDQGRQATLSLVTREVMAEDANGAAGEADAEGDAAAESDAAAEGDAAAESDAADAPAERRLMPVALRLSYVADPDDPDIFRIDPGAF